MVETKQPIEFLKKYHTFIFDCEGTIWNVDKAIDGADKVISKLKSQGKAVYLLSNLSFHTPQQISSSAGKHGIIVDQSHCLSAAFLTCKYLKEHSVKTAYVVGMSMLGEMIGKEGIITYGCADDNNQVESRDLENNPKHVDAVVVANDLDFNSCKLMKAINYIREGAMFICTCNDKYFKSRDFLCPNVGFIVSCITPCVDVSPIVIGKPEKYGFEFIHQSEKKEKAGYLMIGDSIDTDIMLGVNAGIDTALVLTGVSQLPSPQATYVIKSINDLL
jgi:HAD superfamily hydrolase (TIGR01450 family)